MNRRPSKMDTTRGDPKGAAKPTYLDASRCCPSAFTLTFVIEVIGIDVWHDCNEGWLDLGPPAQGVKLSYQLYPGQNFDVDVLIWPHVAKIFCGINYDWVRTWQFLERRWLTFSINHMFPVRVTDLRNFMTIVTPTAGIGALSANSKSDKTSEVYLPPLQFGERRQFAEVVESETPIMKYIQEMIWSIVVDYIPSSFMDGPFDLPYPVRDVRHQDAALYRVQDIILNQRVDENEEEEEIKVVEVRTTANLKAKKALEKPAAKDAKKKPPEKIKYELKLSGDWILAGIGRVTPFVITGDRPPELGEVIALISSINLPAHDDCPVFFVNVGNLTDVPIENFKQKGLSHIYTRWTINEEVQNSEQQSLLTKHPRTEFDFNDHHSVPLPFTDAADVMTKFLDEAFCIELRGIRIPPPMIEKPLFFGYDKTDVRYGIGLPPPVPDQTADILIAQTRIDARALTNINQFIKGEFPIYPPQQSVVPLEREGICTNDINAVRSKVKPDLFIQPGVILQAQMTMEVSLGLVGCKPKSDAVRYSRLFSLVSDSSAIMTLLREITEINESVLLTGSREDMLTGFALDTGDTVVLYVEGPKEGQILRLWERTEDFYPDVKPVFSTSSKYSCRLYPELLLAAMPFNVMKMFVPLSVLLGLMPIYARPAMPLPTRSAVLKVGRLVASGLQTAPCCGAMPTAMELKSFRLELCAAPRPPKVFSSKLELSRITPVTSWEERRPSTSKIAFTPKTPKYD